MSLDPQEVHRYGLGRGNYCFGPPTAHQDLLGSLGYYGPVEFACQVMESMRYTDGPLAFEYVYHLYESFGDLLYVGRTNRPARRLRQHRTHQPWWDEVTSVAVYGYPNSDVGTAESRDIKRLSPKYNKAGVVLL
mgnify:CR=1 FL=1